ncbi:predicted protein [Histoplasma mississippiense (nom. inval.)]|uniref:predicted protein n=1 Tax=Ajellomyces capsulatus (strain NAm1 / WU24) TaxID=2059318 RepID=UPI000157CEA8|nr:predicted protein [Histoplasma mississippiense (nom. inval.)]EDN10021.1 predicted protein [Histoplasma mississippiense (nom. inval.)]
MQQSFFKFNLQSSTSWPYLEFPFGIMVYSSCSPAVLEKPVSRPNLDHEPSALLDGNIQAFLRRPSTVSEDTGVPDS